MPVLIQKTQTRQLFQAIGFVLLVSLSIGFSTQASALEKQLSFKDFLEIHYQSQKSEPPEIPAYTLIEIIPAQTVPARAIPAILPHVVILGPKPREVLIPEPSVSILGEEEIKLSPTASPRLETKPLNNLPKLAIVIDDIGNNKALDTRVAELPGAITLAILPLTPHSKTIAKLAYSKQKEIMLHAPMESLMGRRLGDGALTKDLSEEDFIKVLQDDIDSIPHISGLNNHMGSALTQDEAAMHLVMQAIVKNKLYFVDSRTTPESVAGDLAKAYKISHVSRNVFLDNETSYEYIDQAFQQAIRISKKTGFALAIGHPYPETIDYLEKILPELEKQGVSLISVSDLLTARSEKNKNQSKDLAKN